MEKTISDSEPPTMDEHKVKLLANDGSLAAGINDSDVPYYEESEQRNFDNVNLGFGSGRRFNLKYYQYAVNDSGAMDKGIKNDLDEVGVDVDFPPDGVDVVDPDTWTPTFSWSRLWMYTGPGIYCIFCT